MISVISRIDTAIGTRHPRGRAVGASALVALTAAAGLALAGCGSTKASAPPTVGGSSRTASGSSPTPAPILSVRAMLSRAEKQVETSHYVHIAGIDPDAGASSSDGIDVRYAGADLAASIKQGKQGSLHILTVSGRTLIKADAAFWQATDPREAKTIVAVVRGRWIDVTGAGAGGLGAFTKTVSRKEFVTQALSPTGTPRVVGRRMLHGISVIEIQDSDGDPLYLDGHDYRPLQIGSDAKVEARFTYETAAKPTLPPASDIVAFSALGVGSGVAS